MKDWIALGFAGGDALGRKSKDGPPEEQFVKLVRFDGKPEYQIGQRPGEDAPAKAAWVAQDDWQISKLKFPNGQEIEFSKYEQFSDTANFPHELVYRLDGQEIRSRIRMVKKVSKFTVVKKVAVSDAVSPLIQQFYQRFR